jgi:hypothetical protein
MNRPYSSFRRETRGGFGARRRSSVYAFLGAAIAPWLVATLPSCAGPTKPAAANGPVAPRVIPGAPDLKRLLGDTAQRASSLGAGPVAIVASGMVAEGERLGAFVEVPEDACLLAYARGAASLEDLDLHAFTDDGSPIAIDEGPDPKPTILVCPPHPKRFYVALQVAQGRGLAVVVAHTVPKARAKSIAVALGARGSLGTVKRPESWPGMEDSLREHRRAIGGEWEDQKRVTLPVDTEAVATTTVSVGTRECVDLLLLPDDDVGLVDAELVDDEGRQVVRARGAGEARSLLACSDEAFVGALKLRSHVGQGQVAVLVSRTSIDYAKDAKAKPELAFHGVGLPLPDAEKSRETELLRAGYSAPTSAKRGSLAASKLTSVSLDLTAAGCSRLDLVAGAPVRRASLEVWSSSSRLLGAGDGLSGAVAFACTKGKVRVDLETRGAGGAFSLAVRPVTWTGPELAALPLAGSRMLSRASRGPHEVFEGTAVALRSVGLSSSSLTAFEEDVAPGACLHAYLGAEGAGQGIELRAFDAKTSTEIDRGHGETSAAVYACATTAPLRVRFEAKTSMGELRAVVGLRKTP